MLQMTSMATSNMTNCGIVMLFMRPSPLTPPSGCWIFRLKPEATCEVKRQPRACIDCQSFVSRDARVWRAGLDSETARDERSESSITNHRVTETQRKHRPGVIGMATAQTR